jgi:predicted transcriptional regulator
MARTALPPESKKRNCLQAVCSDAEVQQLDELAAAAGVSRSEILRRALREYARKAGAE